MKKWLLLLAIAFVWFPAFAQDTTTEEELTPDTVIYIEDEGMVTITTLGEVDTNLTQYQADAAVTNGAYTAQDGTFMVPMSLADQQALATQSNMSVTDGELGDREAGGTIEKAYNQSWGISGIFEAYIDALARISGDASTRAFEAHLYAGGKIFTKDFRAVAFDANMQNNGTQPTASSSFKVFGYTVWETGDIKLWYANSWNKEYSATKRFMIGPIPVSVTGTIGGTLAIDARIGLTDDGFGIQGTAIPNLNTYGACSAAVDIWIAAIGVKGKIIFLYDSLSIRAGVTYIPDIEIIQLFLKINNSLEALSGSISVYVEIKIPFVGTKRYEKVIFSWTGFKKEWVLLDLTKTVQL
jgi:hypothetical protein